MTEQLTEELFLRDLSQLIEKYRLGHHYGVSDAKVVAYVRKQLDALDELVYVARAQARIDTLTDLQNDAINQAVNGGRELGRLFLATPDGSEPVRPR